MKTVFKVGMEVWDKTISPDKGKVIEVLKDTKFDFPIKVEFNDPKVALSHTQLPSLLRSDQVFLSGKMLREHSPQMLAQTFGRLSKRLPTLGVIDLNFNCLIQSGFYPKIESGYTLSDILQDEVSQEYFLSERMISLLQKKRKVNYKPRLVQLSKQVEQCDLTTPI